MKITSLKNHGILISASDITGKYIAKCEPDKSDNDPRATKKESYAIETMLSISHIVSCVDQLYFSVSMLSGYSKKNMPEKTNRYDYIVFGIENYYLRLTSVYDRCLRLTNIIFQLGLPERECREATITKNFFIKNTPVSEALKKLNQFTSPFRSHRNSVAHESTYSEKELDLLGSYYLVAENDINFDKYSNLYKVSADEYIKKRKQEFTEHIISLESLVEAYFDAIQCYFEIKLNSNV